MRFDEWLGIRKCGRKGYPYQVFRYTPSGKPHGVYRIMLAEAKTKTAAMKAARQLVRDRSMPFRYTDAKGRKLWEVSF